MSDNLPQLPKQAGWAVEMNGACVLFASNAERAAGQSPGATTRVYTEDQMLAYGAACAAAERERCALIVAIHSQYPIETDFDRGYEKSRKDAAKALRAVKSGV